MRENRSVVSGIRDREMELEGRISGIRVLVRNLRKKEGEREAETLERRADGQDMVAEGKHGFWVFKRFIFFEDFKTVPKFQQYFRKGQKN